MTSGTDVSPGLDAAFDEIVVGFGRSAPSRRVRLRGRVAASVERQLDAVLGRIALAAAPVWRRSFIIRGLESLPLTLST